MGWTLPACPEGSHAEGAEPPAGLEWRCVDAQGRTQGAHLQWYAPGLMMRWFHYRDGVEHGLQRAWWPNGQMMLKGVSVAGHRYQDFEYWNLQGEPQRLSLPVVEHHLRAVSSDQQGATAPQQ